MRDIFTACLVHVNGTTVWHHDVPVFVGGWTEVSWHFQANNSQITVEFIATGLGDGVGGLIDGVSLNVVPEATPPRPGVPEPGVLALVAAGLIGMGAMIRRRSERC